jgi:DNA (cytosine-5)-methyltransferase 1
VRALSLFSGAGGLDLGLKRAGIHAVAHCEIDPKARSVLRRHWPDVPVFNDVREVTADAVGTDVDVVHGGSPCQDLSVAGRRGGLDGERSGLFWEQCRIADAVAPRWFLWENVAGALSSNDGADFAAVLWGITGALPDVPDGGWRNSGVCVGPKRWAVWRLLDAQHFGVPQRRRRVYVVAGDPRTECRPEVLLEPEGVRRDPAPRREAGTGVAALTANGVGTCGADDNQGQAGHLIPTLTGTVATTWGAKNATNHQEVMQGAVVPVAFDTTQVTSPLNYSNPKPGDPCHPPAIAFNGFNGMDAQPSTEVTPTIRGMAHGVGMPQVATDFAVRRLTPRECERLMGWPDDWTRWDEHGKEIADSHRYRLCGNGVVSSVAEWIGRRIVEADMDEVSRKRFMREWVTANDPNDGAS